jgi:hypothetical protein
MQIAPGVDSAEWQSLNLDDANSPDWAKAVSIFKSRIDGRFIEPADQLVAAEESKPARERRYGFAILAIDCLLVKTLGAFILGLTDTNKSGASQSAFCHFLTSRPGFQNHFKTPLAKKVYREFRCSILHQAESGGHSRVWSVGPLITDIAGKLTINRTAFHKHLKGEFQEHIVELQNPARSQLRQAFRKKMDWICRPLS